MMIWNTENSLIFKDNDGKVNGQPADLNQAAPIANILLAKAALVGAARNTFIENKFN